MRRSVPFNIFQWFSIILNLLGSYRLALTTLSAKDQKPGNQEKKAVGQRKTVGHHPTQILTYLGKTAKR